MKPNTTRPKADSQLRPTPAKVAAAKLVVKRANEGKGKIVVTPRIKQLASY